MERRWRALTLGVSGACLAVAAAGCDPSPGTAVQIGSIDHDLARGSTGPEVAALNDYLKTFGYFPNSELESKYPAWRPIVASGPSDWNVFDASVEQAVTAYQKNMGLKQTGVLDAGTRATMALPRCGVPEGIEQLDPSDKWASPLGSSLSNTFQVTWWLTSNDSGLSSASVNNDISRMANIWAQWSGYSFVQQQSQPTLTITFGRPPQSSTALAETDGPIGGQDQITINDQYYWSDNGSPPSGYYDLPTTLLHEIGHVLGLLHSPYPAAVMYPITQPQQVTRNLTTDDVEGVAAINPTWTTVGKPPVGGSGVMRAAWNGHFNGPSIWALAGDAGNGNYKIWENDGGWFQHPGGAVRIAVNPTSNSNRPWVLDVWGNIYRWNWSINNWDQISPGACATDIGVGSDESVWVIGCDAWSTPDHGIYKYNGDSSCAAGNCWTQSDGGATQISVGPSSFTSSVPVPWVVNSYGQTWLRGSADATVSGTWGNPLAALPNNAAPIGIAAMAGYAFTYTLTSQNIYAYNFQPAGPQQASQPAPAENRWFSVNGMGNYPGGAFPRAMAPEGIYPLVVGSDGNIYTMH